MKLAIVDDNEIEQEIILNTLNAYHKGSGISLEIQSFSDGDSFLNAYNLVIMILSLWIFS